LISARAMPRQAIWRFGPSMMSRMRVSLLEDLERRGRHLEVRHTPGRDRADELPAYWDSETGPARKVVVEIQVRRAGRGRREAALREHLLAASLIVGSHLVRIASGRRPCARGSSLHGAIRVPSECLGPGESRILVELDLDFHAGVTTAARPATSITERASRLCVSSGHTPCRVSSVTIPRSLAGQRYLTAGTPAGRPARSPAPAAPRPRIVGAQRHNFSAQSRPPACCPVRPRTSRARRGFGIGRVRGERGS